jgi:hypothetical protein
MTTTTVNTNTLQCLLDYIGEDEARDYAECAASDWTPEQLEQHAYALIMELQDLINAQQ